MLNICFATDNNYIQHLGTAMYSILLNSDIDDTFTFYILNDNISEANKRKLKKLQKIKSFNIEFIEVNADEFQKCPLTDDAFHINSLATYFRYKLASYIREDKVLYLDCDLIVKSSLKELYSEDIKDYYIASIEDILTNANTKRLKLEKYCNAGVLLINLKKWRESNMEEKLFRWTSENRHRIVWQDQDAINVVMQDKMKLVDKKWNAQTSELNFGNSEEFNRIAVYGTIIHYVGHMKPWQVESRNEFRNQYLKYLAKTPWRYFLIKYFITKLDSIRKKTISVKFNRHEKSLKLGDYYVFKR